MSSFCKCKSYSHFVSKHLSLYAIFNDQSFNDMLTNDIIGFEQLGPGFLAWLVRCLTADPDCKFESQLGHITLIEIDHEIIFTLIIPLLLIQEGQLSS